MTSPGPMLQSGSPLSTAPELSSQDLRQFQHLGRSFWTLYASSCLIDLGLCLYFFMFSLFLVEHNFTIHSIGFITAALTVGTITGTIIVSFVSRFFGLRTMMLVFIFSAPLALSLRLLFLQVPAQIGLALLAGFMMSIWSVCFSPTLAKLTTQENRTFGFSLFVATGIASGALAGLIGSYLPDLFRKHLWGGSQVDGIRIVLFLSCLIIMLAALAILRLRLGTDERVGNTTRIFSRFLVRFLIAVAAWNFAISFFVPFANVYLSRQLGLSMMRIGEIFTLSQLVQVAMVLAAPVLYRRFGLVIGIALTQVGTALLFFSLSRAHRASTAVCIYLFLCGLQWMGGPGITSLLMNRTVEAYRSQASALHNIVNLAAQAAAAALAGNIFERYGYSGPLAIDAALAALASMLMYTLVRGEGRQPKIEGRSQN